MNLNFTKTSLLRIGLILLIMLLVLGYVWHKQSMLPSLEINNNRISLMNDVYSKIMVYKKISWIYPDLTEWIMLAKALGIDETRYGLNYIFYKTSDDKRSFLLGVTLLQSGLSSHNFSWWDGTLFKNLYYKTTSTEEFNSKKIEEIYTKIIQ